MDLKVLDKISEFISDINEKNPYYLVGGIIVSLLLVDYFLVFQHQLKTWGAISPKIVKLSQDLNAARRNIQRIDQDKAELKDLSAKLGKINYKIRSKEEVPMILESISRVTNENGVRIEKIVPHPTIEVLLENDEGQYLSVSIFIVAKSGYHNFGRFLNQLEVEEIFLTISSFTIERQGDESTLHAIEMKIDAIIFEKS